MHSLEPRGTEICKKTIACCLFFQLAVVPLLMDPFAYEWWYGPKINATYALVLVMLAAAAVLRCSGNLKLRWPPASFCFCIALYEISAVISTLLSVDARLSVFGDYIRHESLPTLIVYGLLPLLFSCLVRTRRQAETLMLGLALCAVAASVYAIMQYAGLDPVLSNGLRPYFGSKLLPGVKAVGSTLGNANFLGKFLVLTIPLLLATLITAEHRLHRGLWMLAVLVAMAALVATETRASWAGCFISCCVLITLMNKHGLVKKKMYMYLAGAVAGGLIFMTAVAFYSGRLADLKTTVERRTGEVLELLGSTGSIAKSQRFFLWDKGLDLIARRPCFGYGPDTQVRLMRRYNLEYNSRFGDNVEIDKVHNNYLDLAITQGLFGVFAYLGVVASFLAALWRGLRDIVHSGARSLLCAVFSAFCGYLLNDFFSFSVVSVSPAVWSLMGLSLAMTSLYSRSSMPVSDHGS